MYRQLNEYIDTNGGNQSIHIMGDVSCSGTHTFAAYDNGYIYIKRVCMHVCMQCCYATKKLKKQKNKQNNETNIIQKKIAFCGMYLMAYEYMTYNIMIHGCMDIWIYCCLIKF